LVAHRRLWPVRALFSQFGLAGLENPDRVNAVSRKEWGDGVRGGHAASQSLGNRGRSVSGGRCRWVAQCQEPWYLLTSEPIHNAAEAWQIV
jgi:hypothetical protein